MAEETPAPPSIPIKRIEDFVSRYANNVNLEISVWDLKLLFSELQQPSGEPAFIQQHTAITIPWLQAKLLMLWLRLNIVAQEATHGKILVPPQLLPSISPPGPEITDAQARAVAETVYNIFQQFVTDMYGPGTAGESRPETST